jgi:hypothetical protein
MWHSVHLSQAVSIALPDLFVSVALCHLSVCKTLYSPAYCLVVHLSLASFSIVVTVLMSPHLMISKIHNKCQILHIHFRVLSGRYAQRLTLRAEQTQPPMEV